MRSFPPQRCKVIQVMMQGRYDENIMFQKNNECILDPGWGGSVGHFVGAGGAFLTTSSERKGEKRRELSKASDPLMLFF